MLVARRLCHQLGLRLYATTPHPSVLFEDFKTSRKRPHCAITSVFDDHGLYVDQTQYLEKLFTEGDVKVHAVLPRRFSKSTNLRLIDDMCGEKAKSIFAGTHLGRSAFFKTKWDPPYPVLHFHFGQFEGQRSAAIEQYILTEIELYFEKFGFSMSREASTSEKLGQLLEHIKAKGKPAVVLVDEYDTPALSGDPHALHLINNFITPLKRSSALTKLVIFGTHKVLEDVGTPTSDVSDLLERSPYYNMFGFTQKHVEEIFSERDPDFEQLQSPRFKSTVTFETNPTQYNKEKREWILKQVETLYDGYLFSGRSDAERLYNPYSVLRFRRELRGYFKLYLPIEFRMDEETTKILRDYPKLLDSKVECDDSNFVKVNNVATSPEDSRSIKSLWELGVLTIEKVNPETKVTTLRATNSAMKENFEILALKSFSIANKEHFAAFNSAAQAGNFKEMAATLAKILKPRSRYLTSVRYLQEAIIETLMHCNLCMREDARTGANRMVDLRFWRKWNFEYVVELQFESTVQAAVEQLKTRQRCHDSLKKVEDGREVIGVALNYSQEKGVSLIFLRTFLEQSTVKYEVVFPQEEESKFS